MEIQNEIIKILHEYISRMEPFEHRHGRTNIDPFPEYLKGGNDSSEARVTWFKCQ
jgi:hypothetical protein